jgi:hypothetical protein
MVVAISSPRAPSGNANEDLLGDAGGTVSNVDPGTPSGGSYESVTEYEFGETEGTIIIAEPPAAGSAYNGVVEEYTFSDEEGLVVVARPPRTQQPTAAPPQEIVFEEFEGEVFEAPASPYRDVLRPPRGYEGVVAQTSWPLLVRPPLRQGYISFELADAWSLPRPSGIFGGMSEAELQVLSWLQAHSADISAAESKWKIDRRAIAAAIAWEALENVWPASRRAVGVGKVHYASSVVHQVEAAGYLPELNDAQREKVLRTPSGAITYIAAIMSAMADIAAKFGYNIRCNVPILTNEYQGRDLEQWTSHLARRQQSESLGSQLQPGNSMAIWSQRRLFYLESGVGTPAIEICVGM